MTTSAPSQPVVLFISSTMSSTCAKLHVSACAKVRAFSSR
jgi:hypothetical protein